MPYWGIFPSFSYGGDRSLTDLLQFSSLDWEMSYLLHGSLFRWFSLRWAFIRAWHSVWSFCLTNGASFETQGVSSKPFHWIESCDDTLHWGIFPPIIPLQFGIQGFRAFLVTTFQSRHSQLDNHGYSVWFNVQSHPHSQFWRLDPSSFSVWRSEPSSFSVWRSKPSSLIRFGG